MDEARAHPGEELPSSQINMGQDYIGKARTYAELRSLSKEELIAIHDALVPRVSGGVDYFRREIAFKDQEEQTKAMSRATERIERLTWYIALLTTVNVIVFLVTVL